MGADFHIRGDTKLDSSGFSKGIDKLGSVAKTGMGILVKAGTAAVTALGAAGVAAIKVGSDFEAAMSEVQAISGATGSDLEKLSDAAKEMGATTKFSASESAEALKYMAMAGWDTEEMLNGLPGVINLAAASGEALGTVSDIVTDAMTAFGLSTEETSRFVDVLAQTANKSNTNVAMLGESFQYVAPVAGALGFSIEDTAVALGLMANSGIKASQAGTSLRTLFTNLTNPVGQSAKAIEALGISIQNSDGSMKSFSEIMGDLRGEFGKMTEAEKAQYAAMLAGQEGMSGLLAIVNASDSDFQDLAASIAQSNGAAEEMAQTMQNNLQGSITSFRSAAEGLGIAIYEGVKDKVKNTVDIGTDMLRQLREGFEQGGVEGLISAATNVVGQLLNGFVNSAPSLIDAGVQILMMVLNGIATLIPTLPQQSQTIITALANGIFTLLPTLLILGGQVLASLIDGFLRSLPDLIDMGWQFIETLAEGIEEAIPGLDGILTGLLDAFKALLPVIAGVAGAIVGFKAAMAISTVIDTVKNALTGFSLANQLAAASQAALNFVMNLNPFVLIATLIAGAVAALVVLWNTNEDFRNAVIAIWEAIKQAFSVAWEWIVGVWNQFQPYFQMAWDFLVSVFSQVVQTVSEPFAAAWQLIVTVWNLALPYFQAFWDFLVGIFTPIAETLGNFFSAAWEWIVGVWNAAQPYFQAIWSGIQTVFSVVSEVLGLYFRTAWNVIQLIWNAVTGYFQNIFNTISNIFSFIEALFRGDFQAAWDAIVDIFTGWGEYFQGLFDKIGEIFSDIWDTFKKIGSDAIEALKDGINAAWDGLVSWFNGLWDGLFGNRTANVTVNTHENRTVSTSYQSSGGAGRRSVNGSHRSGLDYVPFDGYIAELHKGEMVLTSQQAGLWRSGIAQRMLSAASSVMLANQSRSPVLATAGAPALSRQTAATVQTQHTTVIEMDGRTVAKVITPFVDQFLF